MLITGLFILGPLVQYNEMGHTSLVISGGGFQPSFIYVVCIVSSVIYIFSMTFNSNIYLFQAMRT